MNEGKTPDLSPELAKRIRLVRRDMGGLLFHFTRRPPGDHLTYTTPSGGTVGGPATAGAVLYKILSEATLLGSGTWTGGEPCICFSEAPMHEFSAIFTLVEIAASEHEQPRYEPYGVAVPKSWLFGSSTNTRNLGTRTGLRSLSMRRSPASLVSQCPRR